MSDIRLFVLVYSINSLNSRLKNANGVFSLNQILCQICHNSTQKIKSLSTVLEYEAVQALTSL